LKFMSWDGYLEGFHAARPGITESVLRCARAGGTDPYAWLAEVVPQRGLVLDLGCGSAPLSGMLRGVPGSGRLRVRAASTATTAMTTADDATTRAGCPAPMPKLAPVFRTTRTETSLPPPPGRAASTSDLLSWSAARTSAAT
jgi:hypothetical protein